jgi:hypothetical protein
MNTAENIRDILTKNNAEDARIHRCFLDVVKVVAKFQGKTINKRLQTALEKEYPSRRFRMERFGHSLYIHMWGGDSGFACSTEAYSCSIGYDYELNNYDTANFVKNNKEADIHARERMMQRSMVLDCPAVIEGAAKAIEQFNDTRADLHMKLEALPDCYDMFKLAPGVKE